jgi:hypothetical protein
MNFTVCLSFPLPLQKSKLLNIFRAGLLINLKGSMQKVSFPDAESFELRAARRARKKRAN